VVVAEVKVWQKDEALTVRPASWRKQLSEAQAEGQMEVPVVMVVVSAPASLAARMRAAMRWEVACSRDIVGLLLSSRRSSGDQGRSLQGRLSS